MPHHMIYTAVAFLPQLFSWLHFENFTPCKHSVTQCVFVKSFSAVVKHGVCENISVYMIFHKHCLCIIFQCIFFLWEHHCVQIVCDLGSTCKAFLWCGFFYGGLGQPAEQMPWHKLHFYRFSPVLVLLWQSWCSSLQCQCSVT